jgi:hypothetical protein
MSTKKTRWEQWVGEIKKMNVLLIRCIQLAKGTTTEKSEQRPEGGHGVLFTFALHMEIEFENS